MRSRPHLTATTFFFLFLSFSFLWTEQPALAFDKNLKCLGITFHVVCENGSLSVTPTGLENNSALQLRVKDEVTKAVALDLDGSGVPELYLFFREKGDLGSGHVLVFGTNGRRSLVPIKIPALTPAQQLGYLGHDEFTFMEGCFMRRFTIPDQKLRQIQYRLCLRPTGWELTPLRTVEF